MPTGLLGREVKRGRSTTAAGGEHAGPLDGGAASAEDHAGHRTRKDEPSDRCKGPEKAGPVLMATRFAP